MGTKNIYSNKYLNYIVDSFFDKITLELVFLGTLNLELKFNNE
jgi:hypothetical protein